MLMLRLAPLTTTVHVHAVSEASNSTQFAASVHPFLLLVPALELCCEGSLEGDSLQRLTSVSLLLMISLLMEWVPASIHFHQS